MLSTTSLETALADSGVRGVRLEKVLARSHVVGGTLSVVHFICE
jgi:hypothetical protein